MANNTDPWVGMSQPKDPIGRPVEHKGGRPPKHDYDSDDFYDQVFYLAFNGAINSEIAVSLNLVPDVFNKMVNGNYQPWSEEDNARRSARLSRVIANAREKINYMVRGRYLKAALGGIKVKSKTTRSRPFRYPFRHSHRLKNAFSRPKPNNFFLLVVNGKESPHLMRQECPSLRNFAEKTKFYSMEAKIFDKLKQAYAHRPLNIKNYKSSFSRHLRVT